ncbi:lipase [Dichomitus squalens]|uniref:Lipase n=1 Tax=Dichomitus squalens TaxID=114155 RepID=A0A4Q9PD44_9APHY|nr:lipase [Dichomitus squalens]
MISVALLAAFARTTTAAVIKRQAAITALTPTQVTSFRPYTHYASTGYCTPASTIAWNCGENCEANPTFKPIASGGDGDETQFWFVGFDPTLGEIIVGHQGTNTSEILPLLEDASIIRESLDPSLFPGISSSVGVHSGFAGSQARSAPDVLAAVKAGLTEFGTNKVTVTGHSLGAAIALLDSIFLPLNIPGITTRFVGYGLPRVGNQDFANYVDSQPIEVTHVNNKEDFIPILPGQFLGYHHPSGEVHIQDSNAWLACPGQDNSDDRCIVGDVPNIFVGDESDHDGPYDGIEMGC